MASASPHVAAGMPSGSLASKAPSTQEATSKPSEEKEEGQSDRKRPSRPLSSHIFFKACQKAQPTYEEMKAEFLNRDLVNSEDDFDQLVKNK